MNTVERLGEALRKHRPGPMMELGDATGLTGDNALGYYLQQCTRSEDYALLSWYIPQAYFFFERRFAGLTPYYSARSYPAEENQIWLGERLREQMPPIVVDSQPDPEFIGRFYPALGDFLTERYRLAAVTDLGLTDRTYRIWVDRARAPTGVHEPWKLPCYA